MSDLIYGRVDLIVWPKLPRCVSPLECNLMVREEISLEHFSKALLISAMHGVGLGCGFLKTCTIFAALRSCAIKTFSLPLMIKYPPWSYGHSFQPYSSSSSMSFKLQYLDLSIIGSFPIKKGSAVTGRSLGGS